MANDIKVITNGIILKDADGNEIVKAPLMDLYYTIAMAQNELKSGTQVDKMKYAAQVVNTEYGTELTWGEIADLVQQLDAEVEAAKKNSTNTQE